MKENFEKDMNELGHVVENENWDEFDFNSDISEAEVQCAINRAKCGKSPGIDNLPNEVLRVSRIVSLITKLLNMCFKHSVIPSMWKKAIISPIPKGKNKDPRVPLNYRGIRLMNRMGSSSYVPALIICSHSLL